jgi:hypothetical protein
MDHTFTSDSQWLASKGSGAQEHSGSFRSGPLPQQTIATRIPAVQRHHRRERIEKDAPSAAPLRTRRIQSLAMGIDIMTE